MINIILICKLISNRSPIFSGETIHSPFHVKYMRNQFLFLFLGENQSFASQFLNSVSLNSSAEHQSFWPQFCKLSHDGPLLLLVAFYLRSITASQFLFYIFEPCSYLQQKIPIGDGGPIIIPPFYFVFLIFFNEKKK
jgi:hypothetical protein